MMLEKIEKNPPIPTRKTILAESKDELQGLQSDIENPPGLKEVERQKIKTIPYQQLERQLEEQARSFVYLEGWHIVILLPEITQRNENLLRTVQALLPEVKCIRVEIPTQDAYQTLQQRLGIGSGVQFLTKRKGTIEAVGMRTSHKNLWERIVHDFDVDTKTAERGRRLLAHFALSILQVRYKSLTSRVKYDPNADTFLAYHVPSLQKSFAMQNLAEEMSLHLRDEQGTLLIIPPGAIGSVEKIDQVIQKKLQKR